MKTRVSQSCVSMFLLLVAACSGSSAGGGGTGAPGQENPVTGAGIGNDGGAGATGATPLNGGVGKVCAGDSTCAAGLTCRVDTVDWIAHHECTTACEADADCTKTFGSHTMCIGAKICVSKCLDDSDCPASTRCSENGWCANDGPGSGVPKCSGVPSSCASLSSGECGSTLGCTETGNCSGVAESCFDKFDEFSCDGLSGCYWSASSKYCSGSTLPCSANTNQASCGYALGCSWSSTCTGAQSAKTCESQPPSLCKYATGCSLVPQ